MRLYQIIFEMKFREIITLLKENIKSHASTYLCAIGGIFLFIVIALVLSGDKDTSDNKEVEEVKEPEFLYVIVVDAYSIEKFRFFDFFYFLVVACIFISR